jgi:hypothetical protein
MLTITIGTLIHSTCSQKHEPNIDSKRGLAEFEEYSKEKKNLRSCFMVNQRNKQCLQLTTMDKRQNVPVSNSSSASQQAVNYHCTKHSSKRAVNSKKRAVCRHNTKSSCLTVAVGPRPN